jgi:predicted dehydrogenase
LKALVVGGGSIGRRHLKNLITLALRSIAVVEPDIERREFLCNENPIVAFETLEQGVEWKPDLAVLATPTHLHVEHALVIARSGCHLFIEKPLSHTPDGLNDLLKVVEDKGLISLIGCNMRFHPGPAKVKQLLEQEVIGRVLFARIHTGSYLPGWRLGQDYRKSYSANKSMGGGCLLDCIHEIDLARWYLGEVEEVFCKLGQTGSLEIDVEDVAILICQHAGNVLSQVHLDYVQRTYERGCQIVGEQGSIFWDFNAGTVRCFDAKEKSWTILAQAEEWQVNQMFVDELKHFLECVRQGKETILSVKDAVGLMRVVFAARVSAESGRMGPVREELT